MRRATATILLSLAVALSLTTASAEQLPHKPTATELAARRAPAPQPAAATTTEVAGTTISTTAPVTSTTKIDVGTYAGQALMWVASVFGGTIGTALTALLIRLLKNAGIQGTELLRGKLQDIIVNGLNAGAREASERLQGRAQLDVKNQAVAAAVEYVKAHGAETLKQLGVDPNDPATIGAIKARIETAINDPSVPTPPLLEPAKKLAA